MQNFARRDMSGLHSTEETDQQVPIYVIDLSLPPKDRYVKLATEYADQIRLLTGLFDALLEDLGIPVHTHIWVNRAARLLLRRLHSNEETDEIRGIAKAAKVPMYLLVSFNVILDMLMGCTSGAVRSSDSRHHPTQPRMLHFRTLDWGMDPLRSVIIQLDFIRSKSSTPQRVLASSITYVGFVGVLTGVRQDLSMSLNFRGVHNASTPSEQFRFYLHHLLVLLGLRQSISGLLRHCLLGGNSSRPPALAQIASEIPPKRSTAAYLIFSDGKSTVTMEKDYKTAVIGRSESFIVVTNHDLSFSVDPNFYRDYTTTEMTSIADVLSESASRRSCMTKKWQAKMRREERRRLGATRNLEQGSIASAGSTLTNNVSRNTRARRRVQTQLSREGIARTVPETRDIEATITLTSDEVIKWVTAFPTTNESTHFAAVLDPTAGRVIWVQRYL